MSSFLYSSFVRVNTIIILEMENSHQLNNKYLNFLSQKTTAVTQLEDTQLRRIESEVEYVR